MSSRTRPNYYVLANGIECKDVVGQFGYNIGTSIAYLWRAGKKSETGMTSTEKALEDLAKAKQHIDFEIELLMKELQN